MDPEAMGSATSLYKGDFRPFEGENYTGSVDVASGYILPRPEPGPDENHQTQDEVDNQIIQSSFANFITLKVNEKSTLILRSKASTTPVEVVMNLIPIMMNYWIKKIHSQHRKKEAAAPSFGCTSAHQMGDFWIGMQ